MNRLIDFYTGAASDNRGRLLSDILKQDDNWLESTHDYIQWVFPNTEASGVTPWAPLITEDDKVMFEESKSLQNQLMASFRRMLSFYGLEVTNGEITKAPNWDQRKSNWFTQDTHNNLRITRILKCLMALGLENDAKLFYAGLINLVKSEVDCGISPSSIRYWAEAVGI